MSRLLWHTVPFHYPGSKMCRCAVPLIGSHADMDDACTESYWLELRQNKILNSLLAAWRLPSNELYLFERAQRP